MERITGNRISWLHALSIPALAGSLLFSASPVSAHEERTASAVGEPGFHCVSIDKEGKADAKELERLTSRLQHETADGPVQVLVMVHGFQTPSATADDDYRAISAQFGKQCSRLGVRTFMVGVHWESGSDSLGKWLPKAVGHRITSLLGFKKAVKNPYLEKVAYARQVGRTGMRSILFKLQDTVPDTPVHVVAHSLGAQVVVSGLAPEASVKAAGDEIVERGRALKLGVVTLAGADVDYDAFDRDRKDNVERALGQAQVWWITVPEKKTADGMLELRRGAGRGDALGNRGLKLSRHDVDRLLRRRGLVIDMGDVPVKHGFADYLCAKRVEALIRSYTYLADPMSAEGSVSVLAALDRVLSSEPSSLRVANGDACSQRLYKTWRLNGPASKYPAIAISNTGRGTVTDTPRGATDVKQVSR
ncbi:MAG: alpha/beta hydrolase [Actinomycetota bacterium]